MRLTFRADASTAMGFGHVSRCAALAMAAQQAGHEAELLFAPSDVALDAFCATRGVAHRIVDAVPGSDADGRQTSALAASAVLVADGYHFGEAFWRALQHSFVVHVDDLARSDVPCQVILNPNVSGRVDLYRVDARVRILAGPAFSIVQEAFVRARSARMPSEGVRRVLVTMGGSDPPGATIHALAALETIDEARYHVRIIVGAGNPRRAEIERASAASRHEVEIRIGVSDMAEQMLWADAAITAAGVTATELACIGVPAVALPIADNQRPNAAAFAARGMFIVVDESDDAAAIAAAFRRLAEDTALRAEQGERQRSVIDGQGTSRILSELAGMRRLPG